MGHAGAPSALAGPAALAPRRASSRWDPLSLALAGVILQYVWRIQEVFPGLAPFRFTAIVSVGAIGLFLLDRRPGRRLEHLRVPLYRLMLVILVMAFLSVPMSLHAGSSFEFVTSNLIKTVLLVGVLVASIRDRQDVERLLRVFVAGAAGYVVAAMMFAPPDIQRLGGRGSYDPNDLGLFTVATLPLCAYLMRRGARVSDKALGAVGMVVLLYGTVQTGSRGAFLALVALAVYGVLMLSAVRTSRRLAVIVIAFGVAAGSAGGSYWDRMSTILTPQEDYNWAGGAESGRIEVWKRGLGYMARRPLLGVGIYQFNKAEGTLAPQAARQQMGIGFRWSAAHSAYIQIGAELGVLGLAAFLAFLAIAYRDGRRIGRRAASADDRLLGQMLAALIVSFAVGCAFLSQAYATYLYFAVGLLMGLSRVVDCGRPRAAPVSPAELRLPVGAAARYVASRRAGSGLRRSAT